MKYITLLLFSSIIFNIYGQQSSTNVYFNVDESKLTQEAKTTLNALIPSLEGKNLEITGYTDSTGSLTYNLSLSKRRAQSVSNYLVSKGVNSDNIKPLLAKGETTSSTSLNKNRKVTIAVYTVDVISSEEVVEVVEEVVEEVEKNETPKPKGKKGEITQATIDSMEVGDIFNLGGLEFHPGRHYLRAYSLSTLDRLTKILLENPQVKIEIQGHICCQSKGDGFDKDTGSYNLSENRAKMIYNELIKRGVSEERLSHVGYGSSRKLEKEDSPEAMQRNRRVSILILEK